MASKACDLGRVESNGITAKPSREVRVGDSLQVKAEAGAFQLEVLILSEMRGPAAVAQTLYQESEQSREARAKLSEERRASMSAGLLPSGKPSKRDRRELEQFRGRQPEEG